MAEYIKLEDAIAKLTDLNAIKPNATMTDAKRLLTDMPGAKAVSLHDIYRVIAGHSYYHGDCILAALTCIAEGKEVNPVRPADVAPVVHGKWLKKEKETYCPVQYGDDGEPILHKFILYFCNLCGRSSGTPEPYCHCGAKMDGGAD